MDEDAMYEKWRASRSHIEPPEGFVERIMQRTESLPRPALTFPAPSAELSRPQWLARIGVCAAAVLAALLRAAELLSVFAATGIEN